MTYLYNFQYSKISQFQDFRIATFQYLQCFQDFNLPSFKISSVEDFKVVDSEYDTDPLFWVSFGDATRQCWR